MVIVAATAATRCCLRRNSGSCRELVADATRRRVRLERRFGPSRGADDGGRAEERSRIGEQRDRRREDGHEGPGQHRSRDERPRADSSIRAFALWSASPWRMRGIQPARPSSNTVPAQLMRNAMAMRSGRLSVPVMAASGTITRRLVRARSLAMSSGQRRVLRSTHAPSGMLRSRIGRAWASPTNASSAGDACRTMTAVSGRATSVTASPVSVTAPARKSRVTRPLEAGRSSNAW